MSRNKQPKWAQRLQMQKKPGPVYQPAESADYRRGFEAGVTAQFEHTRREDEIHRATMGDLAIAENDVMYARFNFDMAITLATFGDALIECINRYGRGMVETVDRLIETTRKYGLDGETMFARHIGLSRERIDILERAFDADGKLQVDAYAEFVQLAKRDDPYKPAIWEARVRDIQRMQDEIDQQLEAEREQARQEAERSERAKRITNASKEVQPIRDLAKQTLIDLRTKERPGWTWGKVRGHYLSKCETMIEAGKEPIGGQKVYQYLSNIARSTLSELMGGED